MIALTGIGNNIYVPIDPYGVPTGNFVIRPFKITKEYDRSSIHFFDALVNSSEAEVELEVRLFRLNYEQGFDEHYYTIVLRRARVVNITSNGNTPLQEIISFTYQTIEMTDVINGAETTYSWGGNGH